MQLDLSTRVSQVKELDLQYQENRREKIKAIEGLMNLTALRKLNLSGHAITKIEGLTSLQSLVHLDLAFNAIADIANLDSMRNLQYLNLAGNHIQHIPKSIKALSSLTTLKLDYNNLASLRDVTHLTPLKNLVNVGMHGNPLASLPHYRLFVTFHVPHLDMLDTAAVTSQMRTDATQLFKEQEHETLQTALDRERNKNTALEAELAEKGVAIAHAADKEAAVATQMLRLEQRCQALQGDLDSKSRLLESKSDAFIDASRSLSALEQEFEFYKIDHPWPGQRSSQAQGQEIGQVAVVGQQTQFQLERELGKMKYQHEQREKKLHSQLNAARRDAEDAHEALKQVGVDRERSISRTEAQRGSSELVSPVSEMQELALGEKVCVRVCACMCACVRACVNGVGLRTDMNC
jgi:centriolin